VLPAGTVLTPHIVEFNRLAASLGFEKASSTRDRIYQAVRLAEKRNVVVVLKGRYTLITNGTEPHVFNTTGNPGMATAGSGDVLTGMILGLLAQGIEPYKAAVAAVYLHGQAGDRAMAAYTATDLIDFF
jgi:NAD(P)H-hydrate epimerase